ncbi:MAG: hypothetical protein ACREIB_05815, partial [Pseudomonadota bacterium]
MPHRPWVYQTNLEARVDLGAQAAALFVGQVKPRAAITFGVAFASRHHGSVMASLNTVEARSIARMCSQVVVAVEDKSKPDAAAAVQLADQSATFEFSALLQTEENPEPGYELT